MENYLDRFAYVRILRGCAETSDLYTEGMHCNYNLEYDDHSYEKFKSGAKWEDCNAESVNSLNVGAVFIGVSKYDSMARKYIVIAKSKEDGKSVWYPFSSPDDVMPAVTIMEFDTELQKFKHLFTCLRDSVETRLAEVTKEGHFYMSVNMKGELVPIMGIYSDDDDDWDDEDDDDDEELTEEQKAALGRLNHEYGDDDDEDDDDDDGFTTLDCVFTRIDVNGTPKFVTLAHGARLDDEVDEFEHMMYHMDEDLQELTSRRNFIQSRIDAANIMQSRFDEAYKSFEQISRDVLASVERSEVDHITPDAPAEAVDKIESDIYDEVGVPRNTDDIDPIDVEFNMKSNEDDDDEQDVEDKLEPPTVDETPDDDPSVVFNDVEPKVDMDGEDPFTKPDDWENTPTNKSEFGDW